MDYKTIFIVDPVKGDRIHLAKFIKHEKFTVLTFSALADCLKKLGPINADMIIYVLRKEKNEAQQLQTVKTHQKKPHFIVVTTHEVQELSLTALKESGFTSIHVANTNEKIREIVIELLAPEGLAPRTETPHPVPHNFVLTTPING